MRLAVGLVFGALQVVMLAPSLLLTCGLEGTEQDV